MGKITKSDIVNKIWNDNTGYFQKKDIEYIINSFIEIIGKELKNGMKVKISGLGTFQPYIRNALYIDKTIDKEKNKIIHNVKYISFKPSKKLKPR